MQSDRLFTQTGVTESERFLHTPSQFARKNLLYVQEAGHLSSLQPHKCVREKLDSFLVMMVLSGKGKLCVENKEYDMCSGDIAFINCMNHYEHISDEKEAWKLAWVHFNGSPAKAYFDLFHQCNKGRNIISVRDINLWDDHINGLLATQKEPTLRGERICGEKLLKLLNLLIDTIDDSEELILREQTENLNSVREIINSRFKEKDLIENLNNSFSDFSTIKEAFFNRFGISVDDYVASRKLNAAKELLRFTVKSIPEIAEESGIGDPSLMEEMFVSHEKMSPNEYRGQWAGWIRSN